VKKVELNKKKKLIQEIIKIKNNWLVTIGGKKVEHLNDDEIGNIEEKILKDEKARLENKVKENIENKEQNEFSKMDFMNRSIREQQNLMVFYH